METINVSSLTPINQNPETPTISKIGWYESLLDRFNALMTKFDMPEDIRLEIESFLVETAREQYRVGNRSGISWARRQGLAPGLLPKFTLPSVA